MPTYRPHWAPGHYYHIFNRGAHQVSLFREEENYDFVLRQKSSTVGEGTAASDAA